MNKNMFVLCAYNLVVVFEYFNLNIFEYLNILYSVIFVCILIGMHMLV